MRRVAILADDLIWQTRLADAARSTGSAVDRPKSLPELDRALVSADALVVDLAARRYDPIAAIERAARVRPGIRILAVGQHDDAPLRRRAIAAGAERCLAYRKVFEDGPGTIERWLSGRTMAGSAGGTAAGSQRA